MGNIANLHNLWVRCRLILHSNLHNLVTDLHETVGNGGAGRVKRPNKGTETGGVFGKKRKPITSLIGPCENHCLVFCDSSRRGLAGDVGGGGTGGFGD